MTGTLINITAIIGGSLIGLIFSGKISKKLNNISFQAMGLFTLVLGIMMAIKMNEPLLALFSLIIGGFIGEGLNLEHKTEQLGGIIKRNLKTKNEHFSKGLTTAFLLYCVGSMTILGAIEEGLGQEPHLLITKSIMDGFTSIILTSTLGIGVLFSVVPLFIFQGGLTFLAHYVEPYLTENIITEISGVGGILLIGLGLTILEIKAIKVLNLLPSIIIVVLLSLIFT